MCDEIERNIFGSRTQHAVWRYTSERCDVYRVEIKKKKKMNDGRPCRRKRAMGSVIDWTRNRKREMKNILQNIQWVEMQYTLSSHPPSVSFISLSLPFCLASTPRLPDYRSIAHHTVMQSDKWTWKKNLRRQYWIEIEPFGKVLLINKTNNEMNGTTSAL